MGLAPWFGLMSITSKELNKQSNRAARLLSKKGVQPDTIVAIMVDWSVEMIIGILGILKAGGAYLPIEPDCTPQLIKYMLADSNAKISLTSDAINRIPTPPVLPENPKAAWIKEKR